MKKLIAAAIAFLFLAPGAEAQKALETPLASSPIISRALFRADSRDSTVFRLSGTSAVDSSGVMYAAETTGLTLQAEGTSPNLTILFLAGYTSPLASDVTKADTTKFFFAAPFDSLTITAAGVYNTQISAGMDIVPHWYARLRANTGNGEDTVVRNVKVHRQP